MSDHNADLDRLLEPSQAVKLQITAEVNIKIVHLWNIGVIQAGSDGITYDSIIQIPEILELFDQIVRSYGLDYVKIWNIYCENYQFLANT